MDPIDLIRPVLAVAGAVAVFWAIASRVSRSAERGAAAAAVAGVSFFCYDRAAPYLWEDPWPSVSLALWGLATLALAAIAAWKWKWHRPLGFFAFALLLLPTSKILMFQMSRVGSRLADRATSAFTGTVPRPEVIYVVLDGYGRTNTFARSYGFTDREFVDGLRKRGFFVADQSHANFIQTELSVSSSLNMDYVQNLKTLEPVPGTDRPSFRLALESNAVRAGFERMGYRYATIGTGFPSLSFDQTELNHDSVTGLNLLESALLQRTPLRSQASIRGSQFQGRNRRIRAAFARLAMLGTRRDRPQFTFAHFLVPHPPFTFGSEGEDVKARGPFGLWDGSDFMTHVGGREDYLRGYRGQVQFVGREILRALDKILARPGAKPIVVIQGDHGPKMNLDQNSLAATDVSESFPILNACLVPDAIRKELYPGITPVNTFRTILRAGFGEDLPNLPDRSWYSPYSQPLEIVEVTERLDSGWPTGRSPKK